MFGCRYKKYPLEFQGAPINGIQYFLTIYSGTKTLKMLIDIGASTSLIGNIQLKGCSYQNTGYKDTLLGVSGEMQARNILLDYDLDEPCTSKVSKFNHLFSVALKKDNSYFNSNDSDFVIAGVSGSSFLQLCEVDFREGYIKVYNKSGSVTKNSKFKSYNN